MKKIWTLLLVLSSLKGICQTPQAYTAFNGDALSLYAWEGNKMVLLSGSNSLNAATMNKWVLKMDTAYNYYALCTGREPIFYYGVTYINSRATIADVPTTCGAGCGYLGWTGIEMMSPYFANMYYFINTQDLYDQVPFYELGRNFWFYGDQLKYQTDDPIVTGYAVFMRFMAMEAAHVNGAPFNSWTFNQFKSNVINLLTTYMADTALNWANTLGVGQGIAGSGLGATDLFASFCFYLRDNYCGNHWVEYVWKFAGERPAATTTQDAVDNFIIASSQAANANLVSLFESWKWPVSSSAASYINSLNLGRINSQPTDVAVNIGDNAQFLISSSDTGAAFQWQINTGSGFHNIFDDSHFIGTGTNTLFIQNVGSSENNNLFRCIVQIGECIDTSASALLYVNNATRVVANGMQPAFSLSPNPSDGFISVKLANQIPEASIIIYDTYGQIVCSKALNYPETEIDLRMAPEGFYFYKVFGKQSPLGSGKLLLRGFKR